MSDRVLFFKEGKKRNKPGIKPIPDVMVELLSEIPRGKGDYVFPGPTGEPLTDIKRSFHTAMRKAGIENFRFHDLRHTIASYLAMTGTPMQVIQKHLEHSSIEMTMRYSHLSDQVQRDAVQKFNELVN